MSKISPIDMVVGLSIGIAASVGLFAYLKASQLPQTKKIEKEIEIATVEEIDEDIPLLLNESDVGCLAVALFHEARGEPTNGQIAVANVIMNRVRIASYPNNICEVVYHKCHFSFVCDKQKQYDPAKSRTDIERRAWESMFALARQSIIAYNSDGFYDITGGATYYHTKKVKPKWRKMRVKTVEIGNHIFYRTR